MLLWTLVHKYLFDSLLSRLLSTLLPYSECLPTQPLLLHDKNLVWCPRQPRSGTTIWFPSRTLAFIIWFQSITNIQLWCQPHTQCRGRGRKKVDGEGFGLRRIPLRSWSVILNLYRPCPFHFISMSLSFPPRKMNSMHRISTTSCVWKSTDYICKLLAYSRSSVNATS